MNNYSFVSAGMALGLGVSFLMRLLDNEVIDAEKNKKELKQLAMIYLAGGVILTLIAIRLQK